MSHWLALLTLPSILTWAMPRTIVLDPGHGGSDLGTRYRTARRTYLEKDLTLALAKETKRELARLGVKAVLTRDSDRTLELGHRTRFANRLGARAFVSIHLNSGGAGGIETYTLAASDKTTERLARLGGSVLSGSRALRTTDQDPEASDDLKVVLKDMVLDSNRKRSQRLATRVQRELTRTTVRRDRGVKQAHFHVLLGADMPSILVEAGFLDNVKDRKLLLRRAGRTQIARALAKALAAHVR